MPETNQQSASQQLTLPDELVLMLLNEESGYFYQVPGWRLNCAVIGAVLAELSLRSRIDTDLESLFVVNSKETGDPILDPVLEEIARTPKRHGAQYWIERLALQAEAIIDQILDRLVAQNILVHHEGEFWTLARTAWQDDPYGGPSKASISKFIRTRIGNLIFTATIPDPRDVIIICLVNTCDVLRLMFTLDEDAEERINFICRLDVLGRSMAEAVVHNVTSSSHRRSRLTKPIPFVGLRDLLRSKHLRNGNLPALFGELAEKYGPVFQLRVPFRKPMIFLAGPQINHWANRHGRRYLRAKDYFADFEKAYGASGVLPSLDGTDHFRLRKAMAPAYSRRRLQDQIGQLFRHTREFVSTWKEGDTFKARDMCRLMINSQVSPIFIGVESQDLFTDLMVYKERALNVHVLGVLPAFSLRTPGMKKSLKAIDTLIRRVDRVHTPAQRSGCPRNLTDDLLALNTSDPQLVPESNLRFAFSAALIASVYLGDALNFVIYAMASKPEFYRKIRSEADSLFVHGDPEGNAFTPDALDVTQRFVTECLRLYPIVPMSLRNVMNSCVVEGYELPLGARIHIAQSAPHYMKDVFPDPEEFDIDRYLPPRQEHRSPGYAAQGVGTHRCLGFRWMRLQLMVTVLMIARYFTLSVAPKDLKFRIDPFPSLKPTKKLKYRVVEQLHEVRPDH